MKVTMKKKRMAHYFHYMQAGRGAEMMRMKVIKAPRNTIKYPLHSIHTWNISDIQQYPISLTPSSCTNAAAICNKDHQMLPFEFKSQVKKEKQKDKGHKDATL